MWQALPSVATAYLHLTGRVSKPRGAEFAGLRNRPRGFGCISRALAPGTPIGDEMVITAARSSHVLTQECMTEYGRGVIGARAG